MRDVALWLPLHAIADLVGVPEEDRKQVFEWTELTFGFDAATTPEERAEAAQSMFAYADAMCAERADDPRDDLMSVLLHAEVDGERLTQMQLAVFFMLLQNAGSETTRNLITTGTPQPARASRRSSPGCATTPSCSRSRSRSCCATRPP